MKKKIISDFEKNGFAIIRNFISKNEINNLKKEVNLISNKYQIKNIF